MPAHDDAPIRFYTDRYFTTGAQVRLWAPPSPTHLPPHRSRRTRRPEAAIVKVADPSPLRSGPVPAATDDDRDHVVVGLVDERFARPRRPIRAPPSQMIAPTGPNPKRRPIQSVDHVQRRLSDDPIDAPTISDDGDGRRPAPDHDLRLAQVPAQADLLRQGNAPARTSRLAPAPPPPEARRSDRALVSNLLQELLETEIRYVNDLKILKEFYLDRMVEMADDAVTALITPDQTRICFLDPSAIADVHLGLLAQLGDALDQNHTTAQQVSLFCATFSDALDRMRWPYTTYLAMFASSAHLLGRLRQQVPALNALLDQIRAQTDREISSLQILPVQRLPRYELFLDRMEQHTTGSRRVARARQAITQLVQDINLISSATQPLEKLQWEEFAGHINLVSASRTLIRAGDCRLLIENTSAFWARNGRSTPAAVLILCNDVVVLATRQSSGGAGLKLHAVVALAGARVVDLADDGDYRHLIEIHGHHTTRVICCDRPADKAEWLGQLRLAIEANATATDDPDLVQMTVSVDLVDT